MRKILATAAFGMIGAMGLPGTSFAADPLGFMLRASSKSADKEATLVEFVVHNNSQQEVSLARNIVVANDFAFGDIIVNVTDVVAKKRLPFGCFVDRGPVARYTYLAAGAEFIVRSDLSSCFQISRHVARSYRITAVFRPKTLPCFCGTSHPCEVVKHCFPVEVEARPIVLRMRAKTSKQSDE